MIQSNDKCLHQRHFVINIQLLNNDFYSKTFKCRHCGYIYTLKYPLLTSINAYITFWYPPTKTTISLHRWVWQEYHKCKLSPTEAIHHINRNRGDNRPNNLICMDKYDHNGDFHKVTLTCQRCGHKWLPRAFQRKVCPKCKSPYWDKERTRHARKK